MDASEFFVDPHVISNYDSSISSSPFLILFSCLTSLSTISSTVLYTDGGSKCFVNPLILKKMCPVTHYSWRRRWHPTPVLLTGKSHGRRSLVGCSPWGRQESDTIERLHFHFSLSCIGEGNGNPLQCSCLENPRDGGAWWAAVYGVAQSLTRLKRLSSSSSKGLVNNTLGDTKGGMFYCFLIV